MCKFFTREDDESSSGSSLEDNARDFFNKDDEEFRKLVKDLNEEFTKTKSKSQDQGASKNSHSKNSNSKDDSKLMKDRRDDSFFGIDPSDKNIPLKQEESNENISIDMMRNITQIKETYEGDKSGGEKVFNISGIQDDDQINLGSDRL